MTKRRDKSKSYEFSIFNNEFDCLCNDAFSHKDGRIIKSIYPRTQIYIGVDCVCIFFVVRFAYCVVHTKKKNNRHKSKMTKPIAKQHKKNTNAGVSIFISFYIQMLRRIIWLILIVLIAYTIYRRIDPV